MNILEINRAIIALDEQFSDKEKDFAKYKAAYLAERKDLLGQVNLVKHSIDIEKFERGKQLLSLCFPSSKNYRTEKRTYYMIYSSLIAAAKKDLSTGASGLSKEYIGQKRYEGFDQRCDCEYGCGPSHGYIYQSIGLRNPKVQLTDYDAECCLYLLENIDVVLENLNKCGDNA